MARTDYHKRRVPSEIQGIVIDGIKLTQHLYVPLRDGMTLIKAKAYSEDLIVRARQRVNYRLTEADAWELATAICSAAWTASEEERRDPELFTPGHGPDARGWLRKMDRTFSYEDQAIISRWVERVYQQRVRVEAAQSLIKLDDPEALIGEARINRSPAHSPVELVKSVRKAANRTPLHSEVTRDYFGAKDRPANYRRALEQFREQCGDLEIGEYTPDHCWAFRNWLNETLDEKKGEPLAGQTKNNKMSAVSSVFGFAIEQRHRNDNPMRDVKLYPKGENRKKKRRLYTKEELTALFVDGQREAEWQYWAPLLGIYAGVRLREAIQLRPTDISHEFGVWHLLIRPGRGQRVKGGQSRVVPIHKELIRLGLIELHKRTLKEKRDWLFRDVPLVEEPGKRFHAPDVEKLMVPSTNAATQWYGRYCDDCKVSDVNVDFHALRGTFITYGSQQGHDLSLRMELAGHSKGSGVHQTYIYAGASLKKLKKEIDAIRYPIRISG